MFADTGIRMTELINLQSSWIHDTNMKILGKGSKWRYVPVSLMLRKYMIRYERVKEAYFKKKIIEHDNYFCLEVVNHYQVCKLRILLGVQVKSSC